MKKTKKIFVAICMALVTVLALLCLASCDAISGITGGGGGSSSTEKKGNGTKTAKVDLAEAAENFEKKDTKRTDIDIDLNGSLFIQQGKQRELGLAESYDISTDLELTRIQNKEKVLLISSFDLDQNETDEQVSGLLDHIIQTADTFSSLLGTGGTSELVGYLNTVHHFLIGQVDLDASLGVAKGVYNLKANYSDSGAKTGGNVWFVADDVSLLAWLNNTTKLEVTSNQLNTILMKTIFSQLDPKSSFFEKDTANKYIDDKGKAEYDIKIKTDNIITSSLFTGLLELAGVSDKSGAIGRYADYFSEVQKWFTLKIDNVNATVKDSLPLNVKTGITIDLNIDVRKVRTMIDDLQRDGVIEEADAKRVKSIFNLVNRFLCGTDGNEEKIGMRLNAEIEEDFNVDASKCNLNTTEYADFFIGIDEKPDGRMDLRNIVAGIIENVDKYVDDYLKTYAEALGDEYADEIAFIREKIMEKVDKLREEGVETINIEQMEAILTEIMEEYLTVDPGEQTEENGDEGTGSDSKINGDKARKIFNDIFNSLG